LIDFVISQSSTILESERCSLMLLDENTGELHIRGAIGLDDKIIKESKLNLGEDIAGLVAQQGKPLLVKIVDTDERISRGNLPFYKSRSFLSVPIMLDQKLIGVVNVTDKKNSERNVYTELDLKILLAIVRHAAVAIENAQLYKELKYLTITDPLTNLYNYRHLMESLKYEISRFNHFKRPLCLMLIDVDDFKDYNDAFGHLEGDLLLKKVSALLKQTLRDVDIVCRYAGDEFVVILGETKIAEAKLLAKKVMTAVKKLKLNRDMTLSIGLAKCVKIMNRHALILKADSALYQAKKDGKNRIYCQDS
jgi:diguanylate cyclase (GGDEF)-like protein